MTMVATLCWKEYREQRGIWLAIIGFAIAVVFGIGSMAKGGLWFAYQDPSIQTVLLALMASMVLAHGVVCGAQLLAGEKQAGTLAFLDTLPLPRAPMWRIKLVIGSLLTLTVSQILAGLTAYFELAPWNICIYFAFFSLLGLLCGMVGGALCQSVFPAIVVGVVSVVPTLLVAVLLPLEFQLAVWPAVLALACLLSWTFFCKPAKKRRFSLRSWKWTPAAACWWIAWRQGRWVFLLGLAASVSAGFLAMKAMPTFFPLATLVIGLICGLAVFAPEQAGEQERFLGAQRVPPGRLWLHKTNFWLLAAILMFAAFVLPFVIDASRPRSWDRFSQRVHELNGILLFSLEQNPLLVLTLWVVYGFCFGQFFSLLSRRIIVATVLAAFASLVVLAAWLPSLIFGGVRAWQILTIPILLLIASRLSMWSWFCGQIYAKRQVLALTGCGLVASVWLIGNFWLRAAEIPDLGEPFVVKTYLANLNRAAQGDVGVMIRKAAGSEVARQKMVSYKLGPPTKSPFSTHNMPGTPTNMYKSYVVLCHTVLEEGWPTDDAELGRWLDEVFTSDWPEQLRTATKMPLGLITDPRQYTVYRPKWTDTDNCAECSLLLNVRALQLQAHGDPDAGLEHLGLALALSRQVMHHAPTIPFFRGLAMERQTLFCFDRWLAKVGPDAKRIRKGLELLCRHEAERPDVLDAFKANYIVALYNLDTYPRGEISFPFEERVYQAAVEAPWERERKIRILNAIFQGKLAKARAPSSQQSRRQKQTQLNRYEWIAFELGLPLAEGPSTKLSLNRWGHIVFDSEFHLQTWRGKGEFDSAKINLLYLRGRQLATALALYEVTKGKPADKLEDLVPASLPAIPLDPVHQSPFSYKIFSGQPASIDPTYTKKLLPGQGLLWVDWDDWNRGSVDTWMQWTTPEKVFFRVPRWNRE